MHSIYIEQLVWPVAAPRMRSYKRGVAIVRIYPYFAIGSLINPLIDGDGNK